MTGGAMAIPPSAALSAPHWEPLGAVPGWWQATRMSMGVPLRCLAFRLRASFAHPPGTPPAVALPPAAPRADGSLAVCSPIAQLGPAAHAQLAAIGRPALLIAPNHFHNLGLAEYAAAYPGATVVASAAAVPRLKRRCGCEVLDEERLRGVLPAGVAVVIPPVTRNGELWLSVTTATGRAWIVGDAFFNIARTPFSAMGLLLWMLGISPGLRIGGSFRWMIRDRAVYRRWLLDMIERDHPTTLVPCHGEVVSDLDLPRRLRALAERRL